MEHKSKRFADTDISDKLLQSFTKMSFGFKNSNINIENINIEEHSIYLNLSIVNDYNKIEINLDFNLNNHTLIDYRNFLKDKIDKLEFINENINENINIIIDHESIDIQNDGVTLMKISCSSGTINTIINQLKESILKNYKDNFNFYCSEGFEHINDDQINEELNYILDMLEQKYNFIPNLSDCKQSGKFERQNLIKKSTKLKRKIDIDD